MLLHSVFIASETSNAPLHAKNPIFLHCSFLLMKLGGEVGSILDYKINRVTHFKYFTHGFQNNPFHTLKWIQLMPLSFFQLQVDLCCILNRRWDRVRRTGIHRSRWWGGSPSWTGPFLTAPSRAPRGGWEGGGGVPQPPAITPPPTIEGEGLFS